MKIPCVHVFLDQFIALSTSDHMLPTKEKGKVVGHHVLLLHSDTAAEVPDINTVGKLKCSLHSRMFDSMGAKVTKCGKKEKLVPFDSGFTSIPSIFWHDLLFL